jgi:hypothetical protein
MKLTSCSSDTLTSQMSTSVGIGKPLSIDFKYLGSDKEKLKDFNTYLPRCGFSGVYKSDLRRLSRTTAILV